MDFSLIEQHAKPVLNFSGGKDSLACLTLLRPYWDKLIVAWCNTGDAFPEIIAQMRRIRREVPNFVEINTNVRAVIAEHGWPVDVLPATNGPYGRAIDGHDKPLMQVYTACCFASIWWPSIQAMRNMGATLIIRGQRNTESMKSPVRSGDVVEGMTFWFPLEDWSEEQVFAYLREQGVEVPAYYAYTGTSLDCMHCTGWLKETVRTVDWMRSAYPDVHVEVIRRLRVIRDSAAAELTLLDGVLADAK